MRVLKPSGLFVLSCKDHVRSDKQIEVVGWHRSILEGLELILVDRREVETPGFGFGANREKRFPEELLMFVKDGPNRILSVAELHELADRAS